MLSASEASIYNKVEKGQGTLGIIACGIGYNYVKETLGDNANVLKVSQYPLPENAIRQMAEEYSSILVVEDGQPVVEQQVKAMLGASYAVKGRLTGDLPRTGELTPDNVALALGAGQKERMAASAVVAPRPPQLCQGCGHRDVYDALNKVASEYEGARIFGDIGCYTLGAQAPLSMMDTCVCMGASGSALHGYNTARGNDAAKKSIRSAIKQVYDEPSSMEMWWLGRMLSGRTVMPEEEIAHIEQITREDVARAAAGICLDTVYFMEGTGGEVDEDE